VLCPAKAECTLHTALCNCNCNCTMQLHTARCTLHNLDTFSPRTEFNCIHVSQFTKGTSTESKEKRAGTDAARRTRTIQLGESAVLICGCELFETRIYSLTTPNHNARKPPLSTKPKPILPKLLSFFLLARCCGHQHPLPLQGGTNPTGQTSQSDLIYKLKYMLLNQQKTQSCPLPSPVGRSEIHVAAPGTAQLLSQSQGGREPPGLEGWLACSLLRTPYRASVVR
jgi:hypothetical protein